MVMPASAPKPLKLAPQLAPASVIYGRFVYASLPYEELVELCHAQYCVPNPLALAPCAVAITYWTLAFEELFVLPKCTAARAASAANCDCFGLDGAALALSYQYPARIPTVFPADVPTPLQNVVPLATPWQYCVTEFNHALPPTPL